MSSNSSELRERAGVTDDSGLEVNVSVENVGGIESGSATLHPGVTVLAGENATNRTSFLTAVNAVLGGSMASVKADADEGRVEMQVGDGDVFTRELRRRGRGTSFDGTPFTDDAATVDTYVSLLEVNDARQAVEQGTGLRDVLMRPVNTDSIRAEIREKTRERDEYKQRLDDIESELDREPQLAERRESVREDLERVENEIAEMESLVDEYEADMEMAEEAESLIDDLDAKRERVRSLENDLEVKDAELDALLDEQSEVKDELRSLQGSSGDEEELQSRLNRLQGRRDELSSTVDDLSRIVSFTEDVLGSAESLPGVAGDDEVTAALDPSSQTVECWTCGSDVEQARIDDRVEELRSVLQEKREELESVKDEISDVQGELREIRDVQDKRERLESRVDEIKREKQRVEDEKTKIDDRIDEVREEIGELEDEVAETEELRESDLLDAYEELNELEYERGQLTRELDDIEDDLDSIDGLRDERGEVEENLDAVRDELAELRSRVEDRERSVVELFNEHISNVLDLLEYKNISRVWIERKVGESGGEVREGTFDLHIVRESGDAVYNDVVEHLSESEREVIGLLVALAGYLTHDVGSEVPFVLLDSVEAIDSDRLTALVEYFSEFVVYVVVALLPEDAAAFPDDYEYVSPDVLAQ